ncbi:Bromodomain-containing protein [Neocallimastix californiae]|uniref:Bromodomain-containing protein n=1 Tax=Neocallimastix californiae TaxID=1754190 RepID=A0A1Y2BRH2_9FUNG|nr:Bromodomain-containing protein [Neocallimastix californiae]|eukprot:ORY37349.1 Bromodomain-containing protein [Neocallimastix californiae]
MIWNDIANHRYGPVFLNPVKEEDAPDYYEIIKKPMDLNSIKQRVKDGVTIVIKSTIEFHRDVMLMCTNSIMYNQEDSEVYPMAIEMKKHADDRIKTLRTYENRHQQSNTVFSSKQPSAGTIRRRISVNNTHDNK